MRRSVFTRKGELLTIAAWVTFFGFSECSVETGEIAVTAFEGDSDDASFRLGKEAACMSDSEFGDLLVTRSAGLRSEVSGEAAQAHPESCGGIFKPFLEEKFFFQLREIVLNALFGRI